MSDLDRVITEAVRTHCLGPDHRRTATSHPLSAIGGEVNPDNWYPVPRQVTSRSGNPEITVHLSNEMVAVVTCSPTGKNPTVFVTPGTRVIEVDR